MSPTCTLGDSRQDFSLFLTPSNLDYAHAYRSRPGNTPRSKARTFLTEEWRQPLPSVAFTDTRQEVNLSKDHMQVQNVIEIRLFHPDPHDKAPETREEKCHASMAHGTDVPSTNNHVYM